MRCASYTRTCSCMDKEDIPNDIISQQNERIQEYIKKRKWRLVKKYSDRKKDEFEETAYLQMKQDAMGRMFDCVVVDSMFRCGRNANVAAELFKSMFLPAGLHKDARVEYDKHGGEVCEALVRIHWANDYIS